MLIRSIWTRPSRSLIGPPSSPRSRLARISATLSLLIGRHLYQTVYVGRVRSSVLRLIGSRISWRSRAQWCEGGRPQLQPLDHIMGKNGYIAEHADFWQAFSSQHSEVVAENLAGGIKN